MAITTHTLPLSAFRAARRIVALPTFMDRKWAGEEFLRDYIRDNRREEVDQYAWHALLNRFLREVRHG